MERLHHLVRRAACGGALLLAFGLAAPAQAQPAADGAGLVARWMRVSDTLDAGEPSPLARAALAMAMHDALNAAAPRHARWASPARDEPPAAGADPLLAMSFAAFTVLAALHERDGMRTHAEPLLRQVIAAAPPAARNAAIALGAAAAATAAERPMADAALTSFETSDQPGRWRPTPPNFRRSSIFMNEPLLFPRRDALRIAPPPGLDSARYAQDLAEVRRMGGQDSAARTPAQTATARFWALQSSQRGFMELLLVTMDAHPPEGGAWTEARLVSQMAAALADSFTLAWEEKRAHAAWRPVTAIRAGSGGAPADPNWISVIDTPATPDYPSGHAADCATGAVLMQAAFPHVAGPVTYVALDPVDRPRRSYPNFTAIATECAESRMLAGVHFRFANEAGLELGRAIAAQALRAVPPLPR